MLANGAMELSRPVFVGRIIYGTITLASVLVVYDGWHHLRSIEVIGVIVGPVLAMFLSHVFAASLAEQVALGRPVTGAERRKIIGEESRFLLLAVPPLVLVGLFSLLGLSLQDAVRNTVTFEALSTRYASKNGPKADARGPRRRGHSRCAHRGSQPETEGCLQQLDAQPARLVADDAPPTPAYARRRLSLVPRARSVPTGSRACRHPGLSRGCASLPRPRPQAQSSEIVLRLPEVGGRGSARSDRGDRPRPGGEMDTLASRPSDPRAPHRPDRGGFAALPPHR
jgi:hypothetical protein